MKKLLKPVLSALICAALFLAGCSTASTSLPSELKAPNYKGNLVEFNMIAPSFFLSTTDANSEAGKEVWLEELYLRYGVRFNIFCDTYSAKDKKYSSEASYQRYQLLYGDGTFSGFVTVNTSQLYTAVDKEISMPLENYLADNPTWNSLPQSVKNTFMIDGHLYAIPASYTQIPKARAITDEALALTNISVTDLDSLKNFALAYTQKTGKPAISSDGLSNLDDILNAFGLYTGENAALPFALDPIPRNSVTDFLIKNNAVKALEYLRELYQAGALKINFDASAVTAPGDFKNGDCASYYGYYQNYDNCTQVITLNSGYPQMVFAKSEGYMLTKDTPQPKETINLLVDMLFGSEQNYLGCWLGSSENYSQNTDGSITVKKVRNADGSYAVPAMPNLVQYLQNVFPCSTAVLQYSQNGVVGKQEIGPNQYPPVFNELVTQGKIKVTRSVWGWGRKTAYTYSLQNDILALYNTCIKNAVTDNSRTVEMIVGEYKENMENLGGNTILDVMNSMNHTHAMYYYFN